MFSLKKALARVLAVLALAVVAIALFLVVSSSLESEPDDEPAQEKPRADQTDRDPPNPDDGPDEPKLTYLVEPGDSLSVIEEKTGVPIERIQQLNPEIDTQLLQPGQRLRLRLRLG